MTKKTGGGGGKEAGTVGVLGHFDLVGSNLKVQKGWPRLIESNVQ